jgi:antitoxin ParD1/3/4
VVAGASEAPERGEFQTFPLTYQSLVTSGMSKNTSFSLGEHFSGFVEAQVAEGRYSSASDVVRAALRLLEEREANLAALRAALIEGEESGPSTPFDFEEYIARKRVTSSSSG